MIVDEKIKVILKRNKFITIRHNRKDYNVDFFFDSFRKGFKTKNSFILMNLQKTIIIPLSDILEVWSDNKKIFPLSPTSWDELEELEELKESIISEIEELKKEKQEAK